MRANWTMALLAGAAVAFVVFGVRGPAVVRANDFSGGYDFLGGYEGYDQPYNFLNRDLQRRPGVRIKPVPPPPSFGPGRAFFPHDFRVSGARWYLFSPRFKGFPRWSGYNDTYPRGTGSIFMYTRPEYFY